MEFWFKFGGCEESGALLEMCQALSRLTFHVLGTEQFWGKRAIEKGNAANSIPVITPGGWRV